LATDFLRYLASRPADWRELVYRLLVLAMLGMLVIMYRRVDRVTSDTNANVASFATAVTTAVATK